MILTEDTNEIIHRSVVCPAALLIGWGGFSFFSYRVYRTCHRTRYIPCYATPTPYHRPHGPHWAYVSPWTRTRWNSASATSNLPKRNQMPGLRYRLLSRVQCLETSRLRIIQCSRSLGSWRVFFRLRLHCSFRDSYPRSCNAPQKGPRHSEPPPCHRLNS